MTEQEYLRKLRLLRQKIQSGKTGGVAEALDKLYAVKPVRLEWFIAKAEAQFLFGAPKEEIRRTLQGKPCVSFPCAPQGDFFRLQKKCLPPSNFTDQLRLDCLAALCDGSPMPKAIGERLARLRAQLGKQPLTAALFKEAALCYYATCNIYLYLLLYLCRPQIPGADNLFAREWVRKRPNAGFLIEAIQRAIPAVFILLENDGDAPDCRLAARLLAKQGKRVYLLMEPAAFAVEHDVHFADTLRISLDNAEQIDGYTRLRPVALCRDNETLGDNRDLLLAHLVLEDSPERLAAVLCSGDLFDALELRPTLQKCLQRLSDFESDALNANLAFGYCGDYCAYLSLLYGFDTRARLAAAPSCDFSIVIPARGNAGCLRHTIRTCLEQRYTGKYEVLVSDNSPHGDATVYALCQELADPRLRYVRTPRELPLPKSFEFAFLQARGTFIFSVGADDGVLPWALDTLDAVLRARPDLEFLAWERCFYVWPDKNTPASDKCLLPREYRKGSLCLREHDAKALLKQVLCDPTLLYHLPFFYINAGYRRSYLQKLLQHTGRLWDGVCQDIYIGLANLAINERFYCLEYPLTVAGATNRSLGKLSNLGADSETQLARLDAQRLGLDNLGGYTPSMLERLVPNSYTTDYASLCLSALRLVAHGTLPLDFLYALDWQKIYALLARQLFLDDILLEKRLLQMLYAAGRISPELLQFVEAHIVKPTLKPRRLPPRPRAQKYAEGRMADGSLVLDAGKYGVTNIYEAAQLLTRLTNL